MADSTARSDVDVLPRCHCSCHVDAPDSSAYVLEPTISQIDKEIEQVRSALDSLSRLRNTLLPVSRLPPEILGKIFGYCAPPSGRNETIVDGWFKFSHVSHIWRVTALECPSLWTCPMFKSPGLARAMLLRSGNCPLHIGVKIDDKLRFDLRSDGEDCFPFNVALQQAYRIETIRIEARTAEFTETIRPKLCWGNAARLKSLTFKLVSRDGNDWHLDALEYEIPRLTDLRLRGCVVPWSSPILRNLTSLGLQGGAALSSLGWKEFFACFGSLFRLSELYLQDALPDEVLNNLDDRLQILLPALETLYLGAEYHAAVTLLRNLNLSPISHLHVELMDNRGLDDQTDLLVLASSFLSAYNEHDPIRCVHVNADIRTFHLRAWTAATKGGRPQFHLRSVAGYPYEAEFHQRLGALRSNGWSSQVEDVVVSTDDNLMDYAAWIQLFELFPRCQRAAVSGLAVDYFLEALCNSSLAGAQPRELCYFPRLQEAHLDFHVLRTNGEYTSEWMDILNRAFRIRDDLQMPLEKLLIASSALPVDDTTTIRGVRECGKGARIKIDTLSSCQCHHWSD